MTPQPRNRHLKRAYVAGRFGDWRVIREVQAVLRTEGYEITYDWTIHAEAGENERDGSMTTAAMRQAAVTDVQAAVNADLLVLVGVGDMRDALGCYIEFGAAAAMNSQIDVIAPPRPSIFWHLPTVTVYDSVDDWFGNPEVRRVA